MWDVVWRELERLASARCMASVEGMHVCKIFAPRKAHRPAATMLGSDRTRAALSMFMFAVYVVYALVSCDVFQPL